MGRPALTIALITKNELVRADLRRANQTEAPAVYRQDRPDFDGLGLLVDTTLRLSPSKPGKRILVLSEDIWGQILKVPAAGVRQATEDQVRQALAFEAEPLSGMSAFESVLGFSSLGVQGGQAAYMVHVCPGADRDECQRVVEGFGSVFLGMAHPGGLPAPLSIQSSAGTFLRVELWSEAVYAVRRGPEGLIETLVQDGAPGMGLWREPLDDWAAEIGDFDHRSVLMIKADDAARGLELRARSIDGDEAGEEPDPGVSGEVLALVTRDEEGGAAQGAVFHDLGDPLILGPWLADWARLASGRSAGAIALVPAAVRPLGASPKIVLAAALALLALGLCWGHHRAMEGRIARAEAAVKKMREPQQTLDKLRQQSRGLETAVKRLEPEVAKLEETLAEARGTLSQYRARFPGLLRALANHSPRGVIINSIATHRETVTLSGVGLDPQSASQLADVLTARLAESGWRIDVPSQTGLDQFEGGGPFVFELHLHEPELTTGAPASATREAPRAAPARSARGRRS